MLAKTATGQTGLHERLLVNALLAEDTWSDPSHQAVSRSASEGTPLLLRFPIPSPSGGGYTAALSDEKPAATQLGAGYRKDTGRRPELAPERRVNDVVAIQERVLAAGAVRERVVIVGPTLRHGADIERTLR